MIRTILLLLMLTALTACSEFALLASGSSLAVTQNTYAKVYNGLDVLTIMNTKQSLKGLAYENAKKAWRELKEGKEYINGQTLGYFKK